MSTQMAEQQTASQATPIVPAADDTPVGIWPTPFPIWALVIVVLLWGGFMAFLAVMAMGR